MSDTRKRPAPPAWLLGSVLISCTAAGILSTDLYAPTLPHLPEIFGVTEAEAQLTMTVNLAAFGLAILFWGPVAERFGRRVTLLVGVSGFLASTLLCAFAWSFEALLWGRALQGITASAQSVVVVLIIRETYDRVTALRLMGVYGFALGLAPAVGPLIGGHLFVWLGWRAPFVALAIFLAVALRACWRVAPETGTPQLDALDPVLILDDYMGLLAKRRFLRVAAPLAATSGALFAYLIEGPFLFIDTFGLPTESFGVWHALIVIAYMLGALTATALARLVGPERLTPAGLTLTTGGAVALTAMLTLFGATSLETVVFCLSIFAVGLGLAFAAGTPLALEEAGDRPAGVASALLGASQLAAAALGGATVSFLHDGSSWPMAMAMLVWTGLGAWAWIGLGPPRPRDDEEIERSR
ncbi:multidrug effflux MFS transporter [Rubrimonas sp.]|uniref:multidrug effflux MFS transporter n=1 Tax=Rubrimonas sp. TaxID=2036015 RepID=UPI002FDDCA6B